MKKMLVLLVALLPLFTTAQTVDELVAQGVSQMDRQLEGAALATFTKVLAKEPNNYAGLWRSALLKTRIGNRINEVEDQATYFRSAKDLATKAIAANPNDAEGYFVMSVALGRMALISGSKEKVAMSKDIQSNAMKAINLNSKHAGAWHILGKWNYGVANLNFAEKAAANVLFGGVPKDASNDKALQCYNTALTLKPNYILYMYDKAEVLYTLGKIDECKTTLNAAIALQPFTPDDPTTQAKCRALLGRCK
jgi:regulator of microtubule dynamics protein 3